MKQVKKLCVYGVAALSIGAPLEAARAQCGVASWYHEGARTANGERYRPDGITAAHRTLPFGTRVQVRNQRTGRSITVRINDRGPFIRGRIIDLSRGASRALGMGGLASVCVAVVGRGERFASADEGETRKRARPSRARYVETDREERGFAERPRFVKARLTRQRAARLRGRAVARAERNRVKETRLRDVQRRGAKRAVLREERRADMQPAAAWRLEPMGL